MALLWATLQKKVQVYLEFLILYSSLKFAVIYDRVGAKGLKRCTVGKKDIKNAYNSITRLAAGLEPWKKCFLM